MNTTKQETSAASDRGLRAKPFLRLNVERPFGEPGVFIGDEHTAMVARLYPEQEHYAPLFAAAPELLAALRNALSALEAIHNDAPGATSRAARIAEARVAIAKATKGTT